MESSPAFSIKAAAQLSGVSVHTLRAWERRYQAVAPGRSQTGRRFYSYAEVERIRLLMKAVSQGYAISQVATRSDAELRQMVIMAPGSTRPYPRFRDAIVEIFNPLLASVQGYRLYELQERLAAARRVLQTRSFCLEIALPLLRWMGGEVTAGRLSYAQVHAVSALIRNELAIAFQEAVRASEVIATERGAPVLALATPEGEHHELGVFVAAILLAEANARVNYLGPNLPTADLIDAANQLRVDAVVIAQPVSGESRLREPFFKTLTRLDLALHARCELWIGGAVEAFDVERFSWRRPVRALCAFDAIAEPLSRLKRERV